MIVRTRRRIGCLATIAVGIAGGLLGGLVGEAVLDRDIDLGFDWLSFLLAVVGSVVLLLVLDALGGRRRKRRLR
jgi:uncharacterized membrane protein YeaQ/YmgE (transglycosylase-associated protein family)